MKKILVNISLGLFLVLVTFPVEAQNQQPESIKTLQEEIPDSVKIKLRSASEELQDAYRSTYPQVTLPSPQAMLFEKYLNHQITEYSGVPDISIPLYEIQMKGMKIPVILSYHASGIKFKQFDGDTGAGWSINLGGFRISRTIYGRSDFRFPLRHDPAELNRLTWAVESDPYKRLPYHYREEYLGSFCIPENSNNGIISNAPDRDGEYDHFSYMLPTTNGYFVMTHPYRRRFEVAGQNKDLVTMQENGANAVITDMSGNEYSFDEYEFSPNKNYGDKTSWLLTSLRTPFNESVNISYETHRMYREKNWTLNITDAPIRDGSGRYGDCNTLPEVQINASDFESNYEHNYLDLKYISRFETENMVIEFERGRRINGTLISEIITGITIKTKSGDLLKYIRFDYKASPENAVPNISTDTRHTCIPYQILLKAVHIGDGNNTEKKYAFEYNEPTDDQMRYSYPDEWGYYKYPVTSLSNYGYNNAVLHKEFRDDVMLGACYDQGLPNYEPIGGRSTTSEDRTMDPIASRSFSLKKIHFPTGGYTEYEYEPNQYKPQNREVTPGGGLRVRKIISSPEANGKTVVSVFKYGYQENGIGLTRGNLEKTDYKRGFCDIRYNFGFESSLPGFFSEYNTLYLSRTYSTKPLYADFEKYAQIFYPQVSVYQYDEKENRYLGKTVSEYSELRNLEFTDTGSSGGPSIKSQLSPPGYAKNGAGGFSPAFYYLGSSPLLKSREIYNDKDSLARGEYLEYNKNTEIKWLDGFFVAQESSFSNYKWEYSTGNAASFNPFEHVYTQFKYGTYTVKLGCKLLSSKEVLEKTPEGDILTTENYDYNNLNQIAKTTKTNSKGGQLVKELKYPQDFASGRNVYQQMSTMNMISPVIEQVTFHNNSGNKEIGRIKTEYIKEANRTKGLILPGFVETSSGNTPRTDIIFDLYDEKGNLLQYTALDGSRTCYLWSYNYQYPVAEIKGSSYNEIETALTGLGITMEGLAASKDPERYGLKALQSLSSRLPNAMVTTYTYKPLIGITTVTDPTGITTYYEYDSFNRLKRIYLKENGTEKNIESYEYNYREQ